MTEEQLLTESDVTAITKWCEKNPLRMYGYYRDELPDDVVADMLAGSLEKFDEWLLECEQNHIDHYLSSYIDEAAAEIADLLDIDTEADDWPDVRDEIDDILRESYMVDASDFIRTCLSNTSPRVVATILDDDGQEYGFPQGLDCNRDENARRIRRLRSIGVRNPWRAEAMYCYDCLKIIGTIDLRWLYDELCAGCKPLEKIRIGSSGYAIAHNSVNGSGGCGDVVIRGQHVVRCHLHLDSQDRYGVDAVFGFVGQCWRDELDLISE